MLLALDVGNSQIFGGVFAGDELKLTFRRSSQTSASADELGVFLRGMLRESGLQADAIREIAVCSVVPDLVHALRNCCVRYFQAEPFVLGPGSKTGLNIRYKNPAEVGADRIANAIAAVHRHPGRNLIVIDLGTANTFCAISRNKDYLGGVILPGLRISMDALAQRTAKLPAVEIVRPKDLVGKTTVASIQSGLYFGCLAAIREITRQVQADCFKSQEAVVIGTGGFSRLFADEGVFDEVVPDLVLRGLVIALRSNLEAVS
ncbi:MAG: type III pantothenate kinase [Elusimicrobia bacterium]|nr:type III pantothenate kinase [Elusimicrobiota bacterium]